MITPYASHYFETARERERIRICRSAGEPRPWTTDPIFDEWRFTNVHRENDKTTAWFRENIRQHLSGVDVLHATIVFRWFNRIPSGEALKDLLLAGHAHWDGGRAYELLKDIRPVVTGAYMVHSPYGFPKLEGMLHAIELAHPRLASMLPFTSQEDAWEKLKALDNMGSFTAGEVVWDLRWTNVLRNAPDINTWTVAGPGCARGLSYVVGTPGLFQYGSKSDQETMLEIMLRLLDMSRLPKYWPTEWTPWELHEVEMWACEYAKYRSAQEGGRLKRRYKS